MRRLLFGRIESPSLGRKERVKQRLFAPTPPHVLHEVCQNLWDERDRKRAELFTVRASLYLTRLQLARLAHHMATNTPTHVSSAGATLLLRSGARQC